jgi:hypothetical protein
LFPCKTSQLFTNKSSHTALMKKQMTTKTVAQTKPMARPVHRDWINKSQGIQHVLQRPTDDVDGWSVVMVVCLQLSTECTVRHGFPLAESKWNSWKFKHDFMLIHLWIYLWKSLVNEMTHDSLWLTNLPPKLTSTHWR